MKLIALENRLARTSEIRVEKQVQGKCVNFFSGKFEKHTDFSACAKRLSCSEDDVIALVNCYIAGTRPAEVVLKSDVPEPGEYLVRGERQEKSAGTWHKNFLSSLQLATNTETLVEWSNTHYVCNLDVDFDEDAKPSIRQLQNFVELIQPRPWVWNISRSGGLHLFYKEQDGYSADELASVAAYHLLRRFPQASFEFISRARGCTEFQVGTQTTDIGIIKSLLLDGSDTDNASYLETRSLKPGIRLPHTECPVNPSTRARGNSGPVIVYEDHYFCYICERDGRKCGSNIPGYFPFSAVSGGRVHSQIHRCVANFTHWGHAQHVFRSTICDMQLAKRVYSTLLKLKHGDDARIPLVFSCGEPSGVVRYQGHWRDHEGAVLKLDKNSAILAELPHCMRLNRSHGTTQDLPSLEWMAQTNDTTVRGYPAVTPVFGYQFSQWQNLPENKVYVALRSSIMRHIEDKRQPKYLNSSERMLEENAWKALETIFPNLDRILIQLLIAGRGCIEHHTGMSPMLFITGPASSGKTGHVDVAAAICGDMANGIKPNRDSDRFDNKLYNAKRQGSFVLMDEFFKHSKQAGQTDVESMQYFLDITPQYQVYMIYAGAIPLGDLPFFIWCDTKIPAEVKKHEQIGRRIYHYHLPSQLDWRDTLHLSGGKPILLRTVATDDVLHACNTILSIVSDMWFTGPVTNFDEVATFLQVARLQDGQLVEDKRDDIRELYRLVCAAAEITDDNHKRRFSKRGFKIAKSGTGTDVLYNAYESCQSEHERGYDKCEAVEESDLMKVLGLKVPTTLEVKKHGAVFALRFVSRDGKLVNKELENERTSAS